jgi:hypothetical protein
MAFQHSYFSFRSHAKKTKSETEEPVSMNNGSDAEGVMVVPSESTAETPSSGASVTTPAPSTTQSPQVQVDPNAWAAATYEQQYQQQYQQYQQQWAAYYSQQQVGSGPFSLGLCTLLCELVWIPMGLCVMNVCMNG